MSFSAKIVSAAEATIRYREFAQTRPAIHTRYV
jgi:hypothetical protein